MEWLVLRRSHPLGQEVGATYLLGAKAKLTMQIQPNWQAGFFNEVAGPVKIVRPRSDFADLANRLICGRYMAQNSIEQNTLSLVVKYGF
ncbi:MAG: hypothetical protein GY781_22285 [Gammaproteobacteria bacterium]|nr:hypothetical protein [Gammaproteobacteria bacterium]